VKHSKEQSPLSFIIIIVHYHRHHHRSSFIIIIIVSLSSSSSPSSFIIIIIVHYHHRRHHHHHHHHSSSSWIFTGSGADKDLPPPDHRILKLFLVVEYQYATEICNVLQTFTNVIVLLFVRF
jgi:hypothetical protein